MGSPAFTYERVIRFGETDAAGVVYFANVLSICHEAYEAWLGASGVDLRTFFSDRTPPIVPIVQASVDFLQALHCGDRIQVTLVVAVVSESKFEVRYEVWLQPDRLPGEGISRDALSVSARLAATAQTQHLCLDPGSRKPCPLDAMLMAAVKGLPPATSPN